eukprot:Gb_39591 [translate_table: standard]
MALLPGTAHTFVTTSPCRAKAPFVGNPSYVSRRLRLLPHFKQSLPSAWSWRRVLFDESRAGARSVCVACLPSPPPEIPSKKLYVSGLSFYTTEESLKNAFSRFGELVEATIIMDRVSKRSKGYAFVRYASETEAEQAIKGMNGKFLDGRVIFVEYAKPPSQLRGASPRATGPPRLY